MSSNQSYKFAILTISDSTHTGVRKDVSGDVAIEVMRKLGYTEIYRDVVPDEVDIISSKLIEWGDSG